MALVLSRRSGESIVLELPDRQMIVVRVKRIDVGRVTLGFDAPQSVLIRRSELPPLAEAPSGLRLLVSS